MHPSQTIKIRYRQRGTNEEFQTPKPKKGNHNANKKDKQCVQQENAKI